jgi:hypothetical protein
VSAFTEVGAIEPLAHEVYNNGGRALMATGRLNDAVSCE